MGVISSHKKAFAVAIIVGILALLIWNYGVLSLQSYNTGIPEFMVNDCKTEHFWQEMWEGQGEPGHREMLADEKYVTAYESGGIDVLSERISFEGHVYEDDWVETCHPYKGWYEIYIKESLNGPWTQVVGKNYVNEDIVDHSAGTLGPQTYNYNPLGGDVQVCDLHYAEIRFKGSIVGAVRVDQVTEWESSVPWQPHWTKKMSSDYAYLISGAGSINIVGYDPDDVPMFEIGEEVPINVKADYSGSTGTGNGYWSLWYYPKSGGSGGQITYWSHDWIRTVYNWELPDGIWYRGISDSKVDIVLKNTLFDVADVMINTIDLKARAPPSPTVELSSYDMVIGDSLTISGFCHTNDETHEEIEKFHLRAIYKDNQEEIGYWTNIQPQGQDPSKYEKVISSSMIDRAGPLLIQVWAHDTAGRESVDPGEAICQVHEGDYRWTITVKDEGTSLPLSGVSIVIYPGGIEKTTTSQGIAWFDLSSGYYQATLYKEGYRSKIVNEQIDHDMNSLIFLEQTTILWSLTVNVEDSDGNGIPYATIKVGAVAEAYTDESGSHTFKNIYDGDYVVEARKDNYIGTKDVHLNGDKEITVVIYEEGTVVGYDMISVIISIIIIGIFVAIAILFGSKIPLPFGALNRLIIIMLGVIIAIIYYLYL